MDYKKQPDMISCGVYCCDVILQYYGIVKEMKWLRKKSKVDTWPEGMLPWNFNFLRDKFGIEICCTPQLTLSQHDIFLCLVGGGHWTVIIIQDDGHYKLYDPLVGGLCPISKYNHSLNVVFPITKDY